MTTTMMAVAREVYGSPDVVELAEVPIPVPGDGDVLVRAASVNTADLDHLRGRPPVARIGTGLHKPRHRLLGLDVAGEVEAVAPG